MESMLEAMERIESIATRPTEKDIPLCSILNGESRRIKHKETVIVFCKFMNR